MFSWSIEVQRVAPSLTPFAILRYCGCHYIEHNNFLFFHNKPTTSDSLTKKLGKAIKTNVQNVNKEQSGNNQLFLNSSKTSQRAQLIEFRF